MENVDSLSLVQEIGNLSKEGLILYSLKEGRITYSNPAAIELTGLMENASQKEVFSLLLTLEQSELEHLKKHYFEILEKSTSQVQVRIPGSNEGERYLSCRGYLISDAWVIAVIIRDITEAYQHKEYLLKYTMKKNNLLDTLVHHISGALNLMQHLSTEAEKHVGGTDDKSLKTYLNLVQENSKHCLKIIDALTKEEYREAPHIVTRKNRLDVVEQVGYIVDELKQSYVSRSISFMSNAPSIIISTDEIKLLLIVNNLTSNALKYSKEADPIEITIADHEEEIIISVSDRGIGIPESSRNMIFKRQTGLGRTGLQGEQSFGLGLYISKTLTDLIGGRIWFESEEGKGSTFYLSIPKE
jgi:two-component system sensor histidine kinase VicK